MGSSKKMFYLLAVVLFFVAGLGISALAGPGAPVTTLSPPAISITVPQAKVSVGMSHACALTKEGTVFCWGNNDHGQLGIGTFGGFQKEPRAVSFDKKFIDVSVGRYHSCGLAMDRSLWCWGGNDRGQAGTGVEKTYKSPVQVGVDKNWTAVYAGGLNTCALKTDGSLWCWGNNESGQTGDVSGAAFNNTPHKVAGTFETAAVGGDHTCATKPEGSLWCWGYNLSGELGIGYQSSWENPFVSTPTPVTSPETLGWLKVAAGLGQTCAIRENNTLWCWGSDDILSSGYSITSGDFIPKQVSRDRNLISVAVGGSEHTAHGCVLNDRDKLFCWGVDDFGQVGDGGTFEIPLASVFVDKLTEVETPPKWTFVSAGVSSTCGISENSYYCWGANDMGKLGDDTTEPRSSPVKITMKPLSFINKFKFYLFGD